MKGEESESEDLVSTNMGRSTTARMGGCIYGGDIKVWRTRRKSNHVVLVRVPQLKDALKILHMSRWFHTLHTYVVYRQGNRIPPQKSSQLSICCEGFSSFSLSLLVVLVPYIMCFWPILLLVMLLFCTRGEYLMHVFLSTIQGTLPYITRNEFVSLCCSPNSEMHYCLPFIIITIIF